MIIDKNSAKNIGNMPNIIKKGFNQTPNDIRDTIIKNNKIFKKMIKQNNLQKTSDLDMNDKINSLKNMNRLGG